MDRKKPTKYWVRCDELILSQIHNSIEEAEKDAEDSSLHDSYSFVVTDDTGKAMSVWIDGEGFYRRDKDGG